MLSIPTYLFLFFSPLTSALSPSFSFLGIRRVPHSRSWTSHKVGTACTYLERDPRSTLDIFWQIKKRKSCFEAGRLSLARITDLTGAQVGDSVWSDPAGALARGRPSRVGPRHLLASAPSRRGTQHSLGVEKHHGFWLARVTFRSSEKIYSNADGSPVIIEPMHSSLALQEPP